MKKYKITVHENGVIKEKIVEAKNKEEALEIAWSLGYEDVYVSEVDNNAE